MKILRFETTLATLNELEGRTFYMPESIDYICGILVLLQGYGKFASEKIAKPNFCHKICICKFFRRFLKPKRKKMLIV